MLFDFHSSAFLTSFVLIFIAELGDKTLYTILLLATRYPAVPVLIGACAAFVVQGGIALALGSLLAFLPHVWIAWITAVTFAFFGVKLLITNEEKVDESAAAARSHKVALTTFAMVTAAEWGDASQIGTAALVAHLRSPWMVVSGATLGLWAGSILAVAVGRVVGPRVPAHWLRRCAGILFCAFAIVSVVRR
jgi:putative Ca2+/H+ antiporter (TMEM165/GDT1 family)